MKIVAKTDIGLVRSSNQDSYAAGELPGSVAWAVVCDGMGGVAGGNYASSTAVNLISKRISSSYRPGMSGTSIKNMLTSAIVAANISVYDMGQADSDLTGMGTTVVVAIILSLESRYTNTSRLSPTSFPSGSCFMGRSTLSSASSLLGARYTPNSTFLIITSCCNSPNLIILLFSLSNS